MKENKNDFSIIQPEILLFLLLKIAVTCVWLKCKWFGEQTNGLFAYTRHTQTISRHLNSLKWSLKNGLMIQMRQTKYFKQMI